MQTDNEKAALAEVKSGQTQPRTQVGELRDLLKTIEKRIFRLKEISPEDALEIPSLLDQAESRLEALENAGVTSSSEGTQFESLLMQFRKRGSLFVRRAGGPTALRQARQDHQPDKNHWWWFIDKTLASERQSTLLRWASGLLVFMIVLVGIVFVYQRFLAPDPALQASYGLHQDAEDALIAGNPELALEKVNEALTYTPNDPELYLLRGMIYLVLDDPDAAEKSFQISMNGFESNDIFYVRRAGLYLLLGKPDLVIEDINLVIGINPEMAYAYIYRGQAYEMRGAIAEAITDYEMAGVIAERTEKPEVQVVARMHLAQIMQQVAPLATPTPAN